MTEQTTVTDIRTASRTIVRALGFMRPTLANTQYSASAVHTLLELDLRPNLTAAQLVQVLGLDKSSVSRLLARLVTAGEVHEVPDAVDARTKRLSLTAQGQARAREIHAHGEQQVVSAMQRLNPSQQQGVRSGLASYAQALQQGQDVAGLDAAQVCISTGYRPGLIGRIAEMHANYYASHAGFGQFFESQVATGVAEFAGRLQDARNQVWVASLQGRVVGSVTIDGQDLGHNEAHLRWFIADEGCRGHGVGRRLMREAMAFCDQQGFAATQLWTFKGLDAARHLYDDFGFVLSHETEGEQWGSRVTEQRFTRPRPKSNDAPKGVTD